MSQPRNPAQPTAGLQQVLMSGLFQGQLWSACHTDKMIHRNDRLSWNFKTNKKILAGNFSF